MRIHVNSCVNRNTPFLSVTVSGKLDWAPDECLESLIRLEVATAKIRSLVSLKVCSPWWWSPGGWLASQRIHIHGMTMSTLLVTKNLQMKQH